MSSRNLPPTARRLREARRQGNVPRSRWAGGAGVIAGGTLGFLSSVDLLWTQLQSWTVRLLGAPLFQPELLQQGRKLLVQASLPVCLGALTGGVVASVAVTGLQLEPSLAVPQLNRLDLSRGVGRLFSWRPLADWGKAWLLAAALLALALTVARETLPRLLHAVRSEEPIQVAFALEGPRRLVVQAMALLLGLGLLDAILARRRHRLELMMSRDEVKRDHKNAEGDPTYKSRRRAAHRQLAAGGAARGLAHATALVVNPTHLAVALRYVSSESDAPYVVAKGREEAAAQLRAQARALRIPIIRDVPFARSLIHLSVGEEIPEELYVAAAAVLKVAWESVKSRGENR